MDLYNFLYFLIVFGVYVGFELLNRKERTKLLNRIMAKDYKDFEYYDKKFETDVKEEEAIREEARDERDNYRKTVTLEEELKLADEMANKGKVPDLTDFEEHFEEEA